MREAVFRDRLPCFNNSRLREVLPLAVTTTLKQRTKLGNARMNVCDVAISAESYVTGGIALTAAKLGLGLIYAVLPAPAAGYIFEFDHANSKLKAFTPTNVAMAGTAGAAGADNTVIRTSATAIGVSGAGAAAAVKNAAAEVASGASLTASPRLIAIGI